MTRDTLTLILKRIPGVKADGAHYEIEDAHKLTFYIGQPGQAMAVHHVASVRLEETFVELHAREPDSLWFATYESIHAVADRPPRKDTERRAGFS